MSPKKHSAITMFLSLSLTLTFYLGALASTTSAEVTETPSAIGRDERRNVSEITSPQNQTTKNVQADWLTHANMSCLMWRQANLYEAIREGKEACRLATDNKTVWTNLALMLQATDECDAAIACYEKAGRLDPTDYLPCLGTARCWIIKGDEAKGIKILADMSSRKAAGFDWYYLAGQTCLKIKQNDLAENFMKSAMVAATNPAQLSNTRNSLFLIELRRDKLDLARDLYRKVFTDGQPKDAEIYVRAASSLLQTGDRARGKELLSYAIKNLRTPQDSEAFFLLGRIFQEKARLAATKNSRDGWLEVACDAYAQAIEMAPKVSSYVLARADVLMQEGKLAEMIADLKTAKDLNKADPLPSFILENLVDNSDFKGIRLKTTRLVKAKVSIVGLSCDCNLSKFLGTMRNINGIALISATGRKVFSGDLVFAPSLVSIEDLISKTKEDFFKVLPPKKSAEPLSITVLTEEPIGSLKDVFKFACETRHGPVLSFQESLLDSYNRFNDIQPTLPN
ncbi:hypothetical protein BH11CYA1_BH11CYA1_40420 [soil metagenome]